MIAALFELIRPFNLLLTALVVFVGGIIAGRNGSGVLNPALVIAALSASLVAAGGNAINDFFDVRTDRINRPRRPIPSGRLKPLTALIVSIILLVGGVLAGYAVSVFHLIFATTVSLLLVAYSFRLKSVPIGGNFMIAVCGGAAFIYGAAAVGNPAGGLIPAFFALLIHFAREIIKDIEDMAGDRIIHARTLPLVAGIAVSQKLAAAVLIVLICSTPIPWIVGLLDVSYLIAVTVLADVPLAFLAVLLIRGIDPERISAASRTLKVVMFTGLFAIYIG